MSRLRLVLFLALAACPATEDVTDDTGDTPSPLEGLSADETWKTLGLDEPGYVVYTASGVPHVYAANDGDLGKLVGFTLARDRFFYMDLASRLALGTTSELLGDAAIETDVEQRSFGSRAIAEHALAVLQDDPEMLAYFEGVAAGVNAYLDEARAGRLPTPSEYELAFGILGKGSAAELLEDWDVLRVVGGLVTVLYETGFETKDVGRAADAQRIEGLFDGKALASLRQAGLDDQWGSVLPPKLIAQAPDWNASSAQGRRPSSRRPTSVPVAPGVLERLHHRTQRIEARLGHDWESGFGSNAWVVSGDKSADGRAMLATDGHLPLTVPPLFYQIGIDTEHLGGGDVHGVGMMTPAMPLISTGTNGDVAFGQTQLIGDITDWYAERLTLDDDGAPVSSAWKGGQEDLVERTETIHISGEDEPFTFTRYETFDGRWITSIEGREVTGPNDVEAGETAVYVNGDWIIPEDTDDDTYITATSFDYAGFDLSNMPRVISEYGAADDVDSFAEATKSLVAYSLNLVVADRGGRILYTGYQAVPCRGYLSRENDGSWSEGHDPNLLLHGWEVGGFTIPLKDGKVDLSKSDDPYQCVIPWDRYPHSFDPAQGFLVSGNNDPGGLTFDDSLTDDPDYIGGPWQEGYRADEITRKLGEYADDGVTVDEMKELQANHTSVLGRDLVDVLLEAIDDGQKVADGPTPDADSSAERIKALVDTDDRYDEVASRLEAWATRGYQAASGVDTFYDSPTADDRKDAVATMIFNAWMGRFLSATVGDEGLPGLGFPTGDTGRFRVLTRMLETRDSSDGAGFPEWNPDTRESVYFDDLRTDEIETSTEVALVALTDALDFLEGDPDGPGEGGFGTDDMDAWLWGLRHTVRMNSLLGDFFGLDDPLLSGLIAPFNITPDLIPLAESIPGDDPRKGLPGFPRHADNLNVDAANSGTNGVSFDNAYGSVWRLVVALGDDGFEAYNILPGGQSGILDTETFADQASLWLANEYLPVQLHVEDVIAAKTRVARFPAGN